MKLLNVYAYGSESRSFCFVDELIDGFLRLTDCEEDLVGPINLGNPNEFTRIDLANKVIELTGSSSELVFEELPEYDPKQRQPDITEARQLVWEPKVELEEGIAGTVEHFKHAMKLGNE